MVKIKAQTISYLGLKLILFKIPDTADIGMIVLIVVVLVVVVVIVEILVPSVVSIVLRRTPISIKVFL